MISIAVLASGAGTNAKAILDYFYDRKNVNVKLVLSNNRSAGVLAHAGQYQIESRVFSNKDWAERPELVVRIMDEYKIDYLILAGFLRKIHPYILDKFHNRVINLHPSLLPKYGGKGMYGSAVHDEVIKNNELVSGISIHRVSEKYDQGEILFQSQIDIASRSPAELAKSIRKIEHKYYPKIIDLIAKSTRI